MVPRKSHLGSPKVDRKGFCFFFLLGGRGVRLETRPGTRTKKKGKPRESCGLHLYYFPHTTKQWNRGDVPGKLNPGQFVVAAARCWCVCLPLATPRGKWNKKQATPRFPLPQSCSARGKQWRFPPSPIPRLPPAPTSQGPSECAAWAGPTISGNPTEVGEEPQARQSQRRKRWR